MRAHSVWTSGHLGLLREHAELHAPLIDEADVIPVVQGLDVWDAWPAQHRDGRAWTSSDGAQLWMALGAPRFPNPDQRHAHARIHAFGRAGERWRHLGPAMPNGFSPGSREWSGSAIVDPGNLSLKLYFTAAGRRGEPTLTFEQRIFSAEASLRTTASEPVCVDWRNLHEIIAADSAYYVNTEGEVGALGEIKAFRDPGYFRDPRDGRHYIFFSGSYAGSCSRFNGVVGVATSDDEKNWTLHPPPISADQLNNELERPHVICCGGLYYLFWSTQRHVFNQEGPTGPTGLYGMVARHPLGSWEPLNGTGLVFANPPQAPAQAYSWLVLPDLSVASFVDRWGTEGAGRSRKFGGTFAPFLRLRLDGASAGLER